MVTPGPQAPGPAWPPLTREWSPPYPVDVRLVLSVHRRGSRDPAYRTDASGAVWRTVLTPGGPGTLRVAGHGPGVTATAWGPGAGWLLETLPSLLGSGDDLSGFVPVHPLLREMAVRYPGARVGRSGRVLEALVPAILEQKVVGAEARRAWHYLLRRFGSPAPGPAPAGLRVFPDARTWARIPSWEWHRAGVEPGRAAHDHRSGARGGPAGGDPRDGGRRRRSQAAVAAGRRAVDLGRGQAARLR